jgi:hypothetical protein
MSKRPFIFLSSSLKTFFHSQERCRLFDSNKPDPIILPDKISTIPKHIQKLVANMMPNNIEKYTMNITKNNIPSMISVIFVVLQDENIFS